MSTASAPSSTTAAPPSRPTSPATSPPSPSSGRSAAAGARPRRRPPPTSPAPTEPSASDPNPVVRHQLHLLAIVPRTGAVDDEEVAFLEDEQEVVPDAFQIMDALVPLGPEQADSGRMEGAGGCDRDQIGASAQRHEALAAQGMALESPEDELVERPRPEQADRAAAAVVGDVD